MSEDVTQSQRLEPMIELIASAAAVLVVMGLLNWLAGDDDAPTYW